MSLAIECGATNSVVVFVDDDQYEIDFDKTKRYHFGPANFKLLKPIELSRFFGNIYTSIEDKQVNALAVAIPGLLSESDRKILKNILNKIWPNLSKLWVGNDLESALSLISSNYTVKGVAISGTGSSFFGTDGKNSVKIGGYGHVIGDRGSGYDIAHQALRLSLCDYERTHNDMDTCMNGDNRGAVKHYDLEQSAASIPLLNLLLSHLNLVSIYELVNWSLVSNKTEMADLAKVVIRAADCGNVTAQKIVDDVTTELALDIVCLIHKLKSGTEIDDSEICIGLTGSIFNRNPVSITEATVKKVKDQDINVNFTMLNHTVFGAMKMIINYEDRKFTGFNVVNQFFRSKSTESLENEVPVDYMQSTNTKSKSKLRDKVLPISNGLSDTEQRNIRSWKLSSMPLAEAVELMIDEEARANRALREHVSSFVTLIEKITSAFKSGGRLIYVGAGTSGRLGILDASECPPTFKAPPHWVQGIIAGGTKAIQSSIEGAEDSIEDGIASIREKDVCDRDIVFGIAACGKTPFVWGALYEAKRHHAYTCLLTFNQNIEPKIKLDQLITIKTGPEVLTGSTRLKAGTATKCVLNMLTTLSMVNYGKCLENLMVDLMPVNQKLRDRALRITMLIVNDAMLSQEEAESVLNQNNYDIKKTVAQLRQLTQTEQFDKTKKK